MIFYAGMQYEEMAPLAREAAEQARRLDPDDSDALILLAALERIDFEWVRAAELLKAARTADPSNSTAKQRYAELLFAQGYLRRGIAEIEATVRIEPVSASERSIDALRGIFAEDPSLDDDARRRGRALGSAGRPVGGWGHIRRREAGTSTARSRVGSNRRESAMVGSHGRLLTARANRGPLQAALPAIVTAPKPPLGPMVSFSMSTHLGRARCGAGGARPPRRQHRHDDEPVAAELAPLRRTPGFAAAWRRSGSSTIGEPTACRTSASGRPAISSAAETALPTDESRSFG